MRVAGRQRGYTYLMVLAAVVVIGILAEVATVAQSRIVRADKEAELLFRGLAYRDAIRRYYEAEEPKRFPRTLQDLVADPRLARQRHIRELYPDPFEGEWTLIRAADGGIQGVASASRLEPLKQAEFRPGLEQFAGAVSYTEWLFEYVPAAASGEVPNPGAGAP